MATTTLPQSIIALNLNPDVDFTFVSLSGDQSCMDRHIMNVAFTMIVSEINAA
jgi:hypothetical protein